MDKLIRLLKKAVKKSPRLHKMYQETVKAVIDTNINEITPLNPRRSEKRGVRINLLVPSINQEHLFGGISTALSVFDQLVKDGVQKRLILTDAAPAESDLEKFKEYTLTRAEADPEQSLQIVPFNDRYNKTIPIGADDLFVATSWWTAYFVQRLVNWQANEYSQGLRKIVYLIQDYEPGFYPWSSHYALAESTYRYAGPQIAIFNSSLLHGFFRGRGYTFSNEFYFEPVMNNGLRDQLEVLRGTPKKKKILVYGRPSVPRNAFPLLIESLRSWVWRIENPEDWEIISAGEMHQDIDLGKGIKLKSKGKLTINEYATELAESYAGLSLMISPHPSYPPLEMAHYGVRVITNAYENKDLSTLHENIFSQSEVTPERLATTLAEICGAYTTESGWGGETKFPLYMDKSPLGGIIESIKSQLYEK